MCLIILNKNCQRKRRKTIKVKIEQYLLAEFGDKNKRIKEDLTGKIYLNLNKIRDRTQLDVALENPLLF